MKTIKPTNNQLFCELEKAETVTKSGIFLQAGTAEKPKIAKVLNTGKDVKDIFSGDKIIYKSYSTTELKLNGDDYFIVSQEDVLGVVVEVEK